MSERIRARTLVVQCILAAVVLVVFVPMAAHAGGIITTINTDGSPGTSAPGVMGPFSLIGSEVTQIGQYVQSPDGSLNFTTGAYISGSLMNGGAQWSGTGSTFTISGFWNGNNGTIFTGEFSGNVTWVFNGCVGQVCNYELTGPVNGTWVNGAKVFGQTTQIFFQTHNGKYNGGMGTLNDTGGTTSMVTPEPGTLVLMGSGLLGTGLMFRRKARKPKSDESALA